MREDNMQKASSFKNMLIQLSSFLLWVVSVGVGVITAFTIRAALMVFYTDVLTNIINPWSIHSMYQFTALIVILAWLILSMMCYGYYTKEVKTESRSFNDAQDDISFDYDQDDRHPPHRPLLRRFALVIVPQVLVIGVGYLLNLIP